MKSLMNERGDSIDPSHTDDLLFNWDSAPKS